MLVQLVRGICFDNLAEADREVKSHTDFFCLGADDLLSERWFLISFTPRIKLATPIAKGTLRNIQMDIRHRL